MAKKSKNEPAILPSRFTGPHVVFIRVTEKPLTKDQIGQALGALAESDPVWRAVNQLVDERIAQAVLDCSNSQLPEARIRAAGGAIEYLSDLKRTLWKSASRLPE